jgi:hypothetical protein
MGGLRLVPVVALTLGFAMPLASSVGNANAQPSPPRPAPVARICVNRKHEGIASLTNQGFTTIVIRSAPAAGTDQRLLRRIDLKPAMTSIRTVRLGRMPNGDYKIVLRGPDAFEIISFSAHRPNC